MALDPISTDHREYRSRKTCDARSLTSRRDLIRRLARIVAATEEEPTGDARHPRRGQQRLVNTVTHGGLRAGVEALAGRMVTGTIRSFELRMLWPGFMARFGDVFGLDLTLEGFSLFVEAILISIYVYGWDRLAADGLGEA